MPDIRKNATWGVVTTFFFNFGEIHKF